jgi:CheY-like chemotaxis protein
MNRSDKGAHAMQHKKKVLIVDDDELHLFTTKALIQNEHIEVVTHQSGVGVTNFVRLHQPDLVLLDINMPVLSGDTVAFLMRDFRELLRIPVLFHSSNDEESLRELAVARGVQGYICKGDIAGLREKVNQHLGLPAAEERLDGHS